MGKALSISKVETYFSTVRQLMFLKPTSCPFKLNYFTIVGIGKQLALIVRRLVAMIGQVWCLNSHVASELCIS